jgi:hypothetical protein
MKVGRYIRVQRKRGALTTQGMELLFDNHSRSNYQQHMYVNATYSFDFS